MDESKLLILAEAEVVLMHPKLVLSDMPKNNALRRRQLIITN